MVLLPLGAVLFLKEFRLANKRHRTLHTGNGTTAALPNDFKRRKRPSAACEGFSFEGLPLNLSPHR